MENTYKYEVALSYAHCDERIAKKIGLKLHDIFEGSFFMDCYNSHELTNADPFTEKLQYIFRKTRYPVILYSKNYDTAPFTKVELKEIVNKKPDEFFIINISGDLIENEILKGLTYNKLDIKKDEDPTILEKDIETTIQNIKKYILLNSFSEKKHEEQYWLNIHTIFPQGNEAQWKSEYDWNTLASTFVENNGKQLREGCTWEGLWEFVQKDFQCIKNELRKTPDTTRKIFLNCHLSIAYKLGQIYGDLGKSSGNRNLILTNSNNPARNSFCFEKEGTIQKIEDFCKEIPGNDEESENIICVISIKPRESKHIVDEVKKHLQEKKIDYRAIFLFQKITTIETTDDLESMADYLFDKMIECRGSISNTSIHLFLDAPSPLAFVLGGKTIMPGEVNLYEYIYTTDNVYYEKTLAKNMICQSE